MFKSSDDELLLLLLLVEEEDDLALPFLLTDEPLLLLPAAASCPLDFFTLEDDVPAPPLDEEEDAFLGGAMFIFQGRQAVSQ